MVQTGGVTGPRPAGGPDVPGPVAGQQVLPMATPLPPTADAAFDRIAALVRTVLAVPVGLVSLVDHRRQVFPGAAGLSEPWATTRETPLSHSFCQHVVLRRQPLVIRDAREEPLVAANLAVPDLGVVAYAGMPLTDLAGRVVGSLCAIDTQPREWTTAELDLLADLAATCSAELQLREAAEQAAAGAMRSRLLLELSEVLSSATSVGQVSRMVSGLATRRLGAAFGGITLLDPRAGELRYVDLGVLDDDLADDRAFPVQSDTPSAVAVRERRPLYLRTPTEFAEVSPGALAAAVAAGFTSCAYLPMQLGADVLGAVGLAWSEEQDFDRDLLAGFARYAAQAVDRALLLAERRDVARTLQQAMLPVLPDVDWLDLAGVYRPANVADAVGGDWFDAFTTGGADDVLTVVVGDVTGHDTAAAAAMGRLQSGMRHLAVDSPGPPGALLERLDRVMASSPGSRMATAVTATLRRCTGGAGGGVDFTWSNAGHLPPLLLVPGAPPRYLERPVDLLLGLDASVVRRDHTVTLSPGSTVLLFTDGLVERRDGSLDAGFEALTYAVDRHRDLPLTDLLATVVDAALAGGHDDDTVAFAVRVP